MKPFIQYALPLLVAVFSLASSFESRLYNYKAEPSIVIIPAASSRSRNSHRTTPGTIQNVIPEVIGDEYSTEFHLSGGGRVPFKCPSVACPDESMKQRLLDQTYVPFVFRLKLTNFALCFVFRCMHQLSALYDECDA
jgi:hypothetical protein